MAALITAESLKSSKLMCAAIGGKVEAGGEGPMDKRRRGGDMSAVVVAEGRSKCNSYSVNFLS